ncbi:DSD1 family PLP-dependent enzyme [Roseospira marina]|uniref:3-hydroxy-D-aspartate aldolase n=1 Tax=Roseospira marina TaxID=140057 RepID=A0A5M6IFC6_9PROT|nr:DSD1 family PLP-dependent enzyme [Roseospira marina]KAA5606933.1 DSD1 family PLP-dependent enzyme [Roseospira marina]MBB4312894.1 3-hydroxy-D-aspartate aldolase [Roseospira marina]MBB5086333.1 3-hydroxy-D-aspartate aldolase [Roseospira marina]
MNAITRSTAPVVGLTVPAAVGMSIDEIGTPALIVDLDAFEKNVKTMKEFIESKGLRLRAHAKTHKSADIALYQIAQGGACGVCCQKVAEAEALVDGGVTDVLVSNQVVDPKKIDRMAAMAKKARVLCCVDDAGNIDDLSAAATRHGVTLECLVEVDVGAGRCGVGPGAPVVALAKQIDAAPGLTFAGLQAYQGAAQHVHDFAERKAQIEAAIAMVQDTVDQLKAEGLDCAIVGGAGTGTYYFEGASGLYNELQCGSYVFMDADYQRVLDPSGQVISEFENSLFILTSIMSHAKADKAICDAGLKAQSVDSGLPVIFGRDDVEYIKCSDEHGVIADPKGVLALNEKLKLIPGHCDPTCNVYDWYVAVRGGRVEAVWPVTARGLAL